MRVLRWLMAWAAVSAYLNVIGSTLSGQSYIVGQMAMMLFVGAAGGCAMVVLWAIDD